ncbi:hypothetical protein M422DRAFT_25586 [Sphaerobolus stellatus SS14]|nr:hypothetical protein M422DRAFT_25586 [Sphaerobolus stellatus SS14]
MAAAAVGSLLGVIHGYIEESAIHHGLQGTRERPLSPEQLRWADTPLKHPSFDGHVPGSGLRTGTYPYMSHEILGGKVDSHDAIHDIESFLWVLIHLALTREGPGKRRQERSAAVDGVIVQYFDGSFVDLMPAKTNIFADTNKAQACLNELLEHFHPYFEPVKDLIRDWIQILKLGFKFRGYEYHNIHKHTLDLFETAIAKVTDVKDDELTQQEDARRKKYHAATKEAIRTRNCADSLPVTPKPAKPSKWKPMALPMAEPGSPSPIPSGPPHKRSRWHEK